jgi:uridine kinase
MKTPYVIGVCGRSCSGKSTVVKELENSLDNVLHIEQDKFFKKPENSRQWESPNCIRNDMLIQTLTRLKSNVHAYVPSCAWTEVLDKKVYPTDYIIVEGYLLFAIDDLYPIFDKRIWIDVSDEVLINRRLNRASNGRLDDINYIKTEVIPQSKQYESIQKSRAHIIIDGNRDKNEVISDFKKMVLKEIKQ